MSATLFILAVAALAFIRAGSQALGRHAEPPRPPMLRFAANDK